MVTKEMLIAALRGRPLTVHILLYCTVYARGGPSMGKYEPLAQFLRKQQTHEVRLTFSEIERIVGARLPPSARKQRAWWDC